MLSVLRVLSTSTLVSSTRNPAVPPLHLALRQNSQLLRVELLISCKKLLQDCFE